MNRSRLALLARFALLLLGMDGSAARAAETPVAAPETNAYVIDLPTALRLSGARNLDVQIARARLAEAKANDESALWQFFPALTPGFGYRRHDHFIQDVGGNIVDVHKESYTLGPTFSVQLDLGEAIYRKLSARQLAAAAAAAVDSQQQESALAAAHGFFDLLRARAAGLVAIEAVRIAEDYAAQVRHAVSAGLAFKGDALRAEVQADRNRLTLRQAEEALAIATARLIQTLHLDSRVTLFAPHDDLVPLILFPTNLPLPSLIAQALEARPERKQSHAQAEAARRLKEGAKFGPLIPTLGAQVFAGGLGGGIDDAPGRFGQSEDYQVTLGWRIGPGGLFDRGRVRASEARLSVARLTDEKLSDEITREVVESHARMQSAFDQISTARRAVQAAEQTLRLTQARKEFAVGQVLETIQAEQELTRARLDYLNSVAEFNKAQYSLRQAVGVPPEASPRSE